MDVLLTGTAVAPGAPLGLVNARVEVWDTAAGAQRPLASAIVKPGGTFAVAVPDRVVSTLAQREIEFRVAYRGMAARLQQAVTWRAGQRTDGIRLDVALDTSGTDLQSDRSVTGRVTLRGTDQPAEGVLVRVFDRALRHEQALGETHTGRDGHYRIVYGAAATGNRTAANLVVRVYDGGGDTLLFEPPTEALQVGAPANATVNIVLAQSPPRSQPQYTVLRRTLTPLLGQVRLESLTEDARTRDITFLSNQARVPGDQIEHLVVAQRLADATSVDAEPFYALLRMNTLLQQTAIPTLPTRIRNGVNDNTHDILLTAALVEPARIRADIVQAVRQRIVTAAAEEHAEALLHALGRLRAEAEAAQRAAASKTLIEHVAPLLQQPDNLKAVLDLARSRDGKFMDRLEAMVTNWRTPARPGLPPGGAATGNGPAGTATPGADAEQSGTTDPATPAGPQATAGPTRVNVTAGALQAHVRADAIPLRNRAATLNVLSLHSDIDLARAHLDTVFAEKGLNEPEHRTVLSDLKRVQRLTRLTADVPAAGKLMAENIHSAADIVATGRSRFLTEIAPKIGLTPTAAKAAFGKAQARHAAATILAGEVQSLTSVAAAAAGGAAMPELLKASPAFPDLITLFGSPSLCACTQCRSIYSPAAYLVELLEFLDKRSMLDLTQVPPAKINLAKQILLSRRGEIADLDLNCDNAMTPLPYIDLVNELLEEQVAPDPGVVHNGPVAPGVAPAALLATLSAAGWRLTPSAIVQAPDANGDLILRDAGITAKLHNEGIDTWRARVLRQTHATAAELAAAPEYVNSAAYAMLAGAEFAFTLPFDLAHTEAAAYFDRFGLARSKLMRDLASGGAPAAAAIAAEALGLTDAERSLVTTAAATSAEQGTIWSLPAASVVATMAVVETMLDKTGLTYDGLNRLLQLAFIDPARTLFIKHLDMSCDLTQKEVAGLDAAALDRIHRFLRLQRATGWADTVVDAGLNDPALGAGTLDDAALIALEQIQRIGSRTGLQPEELTACFGSIPHAVMTGTTDQPLYSRLFLNKAVLGSIPDGLRPAAIGVGNAISGQAGPLSTLLKLPAADFDTLRAAVTDDNLTFANLSRLYCAARLCATLGLKVVDFLTLRARSGVDPWTGPGQMLTLLDHNDRIRSGPVKLGDVPFVLQHTGADVSQRAVSDSRITALLTGLQSSYQTAFGQTRSTFSADLTADELRASIHDALLRLTGLTEDDTKTVLRMYDAAWTTPPDPPAAATLASLLGSFFDTAPLAAAQAAVAIAAPPALEAARIAMAEMLLDSIAASLFAAAKQAALVDGLAAFARQSSDLVQGVLATAILQQPGPAKPKLADLLGSDALIDMVGTPPAPPAISEAAFGDQFNAGRLLAKLLPLAAATGLSADDLAWVLTNAAAMGWVTLDAIPYQAGQASVAQSDWEKLTRMLALFASLTPTVNPADPTVPVTLAATLTLLLPGAATMRPQWLDALALLTGYDRQTLDDLDAHFGWSAPDLTAWRAPDAWETMIACMADLRTLSASVADALGYIKPALTDADSTALRTALKSRYADDIWLTTLAEISNAIRPKKRDALAAYLLATNSAWTTPADLYDYLLIDTQMGSKVDASRIVQAHGTIQLFVQRSRMGLEPQAAADTSDTGWNQWTWMANFQVWVANRKIFTTPEDWIEPELLDTKSALFEQLESDLLQNDVTDQTTEDAYIRYLEGLDGISFLEVITACYQEDIYTLHIFARTKGGDPAQYYYRTLEKERNWSPWQLVQVDITSDSLLAFIRNHRLHLAWPVISQETNPDQQVTTPGVSDSPSTGPMQHPEARLKIQLAVAEYANGAWKPKTISQDAVISPPGYTTDQSELDGGNFNLMYMPFADQIWLFRTSLSGFSEYQLVSGIFAVAGCKGYPEVVFSGDSYFPDFFPDFRDALLERQRYFELNQDPPETLAIRNMITFWDFVVRLNATPTLYRATSVLQFTLIDLLYVLWQLWSIQSHGGFTASFRRGFKLPLGTWMPYFYEDSQHAYIVVPGLYSPEQGGTDQSLTFSDLLQLVEAIIALAEKYLAMLTGEPPVTPADALKALAADPDFLRIRDELLLLGKLRFGEQFRNLYHPLVCPLRATLYKDGVGPMMARDQQLQQTSFDFNTYYQPTSIVARPYPVEELDFTPTGAYSLYNWELFFHAPLMIANRLASEQQFDQAMVWYHRIFDPTGTLPGTSPQKYWVTKPFYLTAAADYAAQRIDRLMTNLADPASPERQALEQAVDDWRTHPFRPHVVAKYRTTAYQRTVVMNYVNTLISWGDYLFRQDTMEAITQATQLYILADNLLGPKPRVVPPPVEDPGETYMQLAGRLDAFGNALVELENYLPDLSVLPEHGNELPPPPVTLASLYFCIPPDDAVLSVWDTVADRLFKIRNSQNIDGVERVLALFAPPIDPGMLVRAVAAGLDLSTILAGINAPLPAYRFEPMVRRAVDFTQDVRNLGASLLGALEKKDAEVLALLRNDLEVKLLTAQRDLKSMAIDAAQDEITVLQRARDISDERRAFYAAWTRINANEQLNLDKMGDANDQQQAASIVRATGAVLGIIPDIAVGGHGAGGSPAVHASFGGSTLAHVADASAAVLTMLSGVASYEAARAGALGGLDRRADDAAMQARVGQKELDHIDQQITTARLRHDIAVKDLAVHDVQIANSQKISDTLKSKYTNADLYQWMIDDITAVYYQAYQLAYATAKKAERCYQHELGTNDSFLAFGYWDSRKKGLQAADKLLFDIRRMQAKYVDADKREYEITKHVSLRELDPLALTKLRVTGSCDFEIPEALYDLDHPGHYFRRVKSIAVTIPCVAGPYSSVSARLTQVSNRYRANTNRTAGAATPQQAYEEADGGGDPRFVYNVGTSQSIATSSAQNDPGLFQLEFSDERYLPFERTGAIGAWRLELPDTVRQFDYGTIANLIIHIRYTARDGGSGLRGLASASLMAKLQQIKQGLSKTGLHTLLDLKRDDYNSWHALKSTGSATLTIGADRLPYFVQPLSPTLGTATLLVQVNGNPASYPVTVQGSAVALGFQASWGFNLNDINGLALDTPVTLSLTPGQLPVLQELCLVMKIDTP